MKVAVISFADVTKNNPTLCLSAHRGLNECHKCDQFKKKLGKYITVEKAFKTLKCKPHIPEEIITKSNHRAELIIQKQAIEKEIEES